MRTVGMWVATVLVAVALNGCGGNGGSVALPDADRAAIQKSIVTDAGAALAAKDFAAFANLYTEDAAYLPPNAPAVKGRAAMVTFLSGFPPYSDFKLGPATIHGSGDVAYVQGTFSMMVTPAGASAPVAEQGKWLVGARKQTDGSWKAAVGIFNSDLPVAAPAAPVK